MDVEKLKIDDVSAVSQMLSILVLDTDPEYVEIIGDTLSGEPYQLSLTTVDSVAVARMRGAAFDLVIMEVSERLLDETVQLVRQFVRLRPHLGLIFTSHSRLSVTETRTLYDAGADDYIEKPFHPALFVMRVAAVARRTRLHMSAHIDGGLPGLHLDAREGVAQYCGQDLGLTITEFLMLHELCLMPGSVVPYVRLNARILGNLTPDDGSTLRTHVSSLRRKLQAAEIDPEIVSTERGVGYALRIPAHLLKPPEDKGSTAVGR